MLLLLFSFSFNFGMFHVNGWGAQIYIYNVTNVLMYSTVFIWKYIMFSFVNSEPMNGGGGMRHVARG